MSTYTTLVRVSAPTLDILRQGIEKMLHDGRGHCGKGSLGVYPLYGYDRYDRNLIEQWCSARPDVIAYRVDSESVYTVVNERGGEGYIVKID